MPPPSPREDRDQRGAEGQRHQRVDHFAAVGRIAHHLDQHPEQHGDRQQSQPGDQHSGDRAGAESEGEAGLQPLFGGRRGADVGAHRDVHPDITGEAGQDRADDEGDRAGPVEEQSNQDRDDHADDPDRRVLPVEIGLRAFLDRAGDLLHPGVPCGRAEHLAAGDDAVENGQQAEEYRDDHEVHVSPSPPFAAAPACMDGARADAPLYKPMPMAQEEGRRVHRLSPFGTVGIAMPVAEPRPGRRRRAVEQHGVRAGRADRPDARD